jgi:ERCC4-related helicase
LIIRLLKELLTEVAKFENDGKIQEFSKYLDKVITENEYGKKVLVFSFFADTISYLQNNLAGKLGDKAEFVSGNKAVENIVSRFAPISKKYELKEGEEEIDYLFATDVLSE